MKALKPLSLFWVFILSSCSSVYVNTDYDKKADFASYKSYAYNKTSIDKVEISDLDKKRILRSIDEVLASKGFNKSKTPDLLVSIFTKESKTVDIRPNTNWGYGFCWGSSWEMGYTRTTAIPEGTLYIDLIDAKTKELVWQGNGTGYLKTNPEEKDKRIREFVAEILAQYPPTKK